MHTDSHIDKRHPAMRVHDYCSPYTHTCIHRHHRQQHRPLVDHLRVRSVVHNARQAPIASPPRHAHVHTRQHACLHDGYTSVREAIPRNCLRRAHPCTCPCKCMHARADSMLTRTHSRMCLCVRLSHYPNTHTSSLVSVWDSRSVKKHPCRRRVRSSHHTEVNV